MHGIIAGAASSDCPMSDFFWTIEPSLNQRVELNLEERPSGLLVCAMLAGVEQQPEEPTL